LVAGGLDLNHRPLGYEFRGKLQIQILCGAADNPRDRMNTGRSQYRDPNLTLQFSISDVNRCSGELCAFGDLVGIQLLEGRRFKLRWKPALSWQSFLVAWPLHPGVTRVRVLRDVVTNSQLIAGKLVNPGK